jgi:hypothetical protein
MLRWVLNLVAAKTTRSTWSLQNRQASATHGCRYGYHLARQVIAADGWHTIWAQLSTAMTTLVFSRSSRVIRVYSAVLFHLMQSTLLHNSSPDDVIDVSHAYFNAYKPHKSLTNCNGCKSRNSLAPYNASPSLNLQPSDKVCIYF